ncbi:hypothetical protein RSWS8N_15709 [Cereibacter sphaeroides WS8N]|nr:hypothetical protein RSWS8N_15709 [Cereibacter sphaeroides WS8N]
MLRDDGEAFGTRSDYDADDDASRIPPVSELLAETAHAPAEVRATRLARELQYQDRFFDQGVDTRRAWLHAAGLSDHYQHKKLWSWFLGLTLCGMITFQWMLLAMVGWHYWDFTQYQWLLPILLVQNLGQVIGLVFVVIRSLFKDMPA